MCAALLPAGRACNPMQLLLGSSCGPGSMSSWTRSALHCFHSRRSSNNGSSREIKLLHDCIVASASAPDAAGDSSSNSHSSSSKASSTPPYYIGKIRQSASNCSGDNDDSSNSSSSTVVNKEPISSSMSPALYQYLLAHTREHPLLAELRHETSQMQGAQMQIAPEQGQLLGLLVELLGVQKAIEVGVYTGYSSLAVALALPAGGRLAAFDRDAKTLAVAQRYWTRAGVEGKVQSCLGPALDGLQLLLDQEGKDSFDMAFIDADKRGYQAYFELCLQLVRPGGLIVVDNVLFYGKVADPVAGDKATLSLRAFNDSLLADERVSYSIVPVGDGMALCRKI